MITVVMIVPLALTADGCLMSASLTIRKSTLIVSLFRTAYVYIHIHTVSPRFLRGACSTHLSQSRCNGLLEAATSSWALQALKSQIQSSMRLRDV